jgi:hypothetical protein
MSPSGAPAPAPSGWPALQIKLREVGGIGGLQRTVALEGNTLRVLDRDQLRIERQLPINILRAFADRVKALERIRPRRSYGRYGFTSDILTTQLEIRYDSNGLNVEVVSDPTDPAPFQFWEVVNYLQRLSTADVRATAFDL